ncbi:hypothetical protein [Roseobacter sp.]|uniref:hypothetical protein n=1 Tax=Roseobacter sp. TaxID=1907202 RepID=UPI0032996F00
MTGLALLLRAARSDQTRLIAEISLALVGKDTERLRRLAQGVLVLWRIAMPLGTGASYPVSFPPWVAESTIG